MSSSNLILCFLNLSIYSFSKLSLYSFRLIDNYNYWTYDLGSFSFLSIIYYIINENYIIYYSTRTPITHLSTDQSRYLSKDTSVQHRKDQNFLLMVWLCRRHQICYILVTELNKQQLHCQIRVNYVGQVLNRHIKSIFHMQQLKIKPDDPKLHY